jgi:hypothetical protein
LRVCIVTEETPQKLEYKTNERIKTLENLGVTIIDVRMDSAGSEPCLYAFITYAEDIS